MWSCQLNKRRHVQNKPKTAQSKSKSVRRECLRAATIIHLRSLNPSNLDTMLANKATANTALSSGLHARFTNAALARKCRDTLSPMYTFINYSARFSSSVASLSPFITPSLVRIGLIARLFQKLSYIPHTQTWNVFRGEARDHGGTYTPIQVKVYFILILTSSIARCPVNVSNASSSVRTRE